MDSGNESDAKTMSTQMLEDIRGGSKSHLSINRRQTCYKIRDRIKQRQWEWKGSFLSTQNMGKGLQNILKML